MAIDLQREFEKRKPWVTKFVVDGRAYGGQYEAARDSRLEQFQQCFPAAANVLELGSLEGGHSFALASLPHVQRVVAVEGRAANLKRARFIQSLTPQNKVQFVHANLEAFDLTQLGRFDSALCIGVLYHLPKPWKLLEKIARVTDGLLLWTHYCENERAKKTRGKYRGRLYIEWLFAFEALSGLSPTSFWPTRGDLLQMLDDAGFKRSVVLDDQPSHEHGPAATIAAYKN